MVRDLEKEIATAHLQHNSTKSQKDEETVASGVGTLWILSF
jgi:hypothetical protein